MRYLLLSCGDESAAAHAGDGCGGWDQETQSCGVLQSVAGLHPPTDATTVRVRADRVVLSDGPYAETKEQIGGFCLIECDDLDEAIEIAARHPAASYGTVEIRPVRGAPVQPA